MENNLTDRAFWKSFWESRIGLIFKIKPNYVFGDILGKIIKDTQAKTAVELGGFPGYYAIYLKKYKGLSTTLLDYFIHPELVNQLLTVNELKAGDINIIEADLFKYVPVEKYDMVLSFGLIEHFNDTQFIIGEHLKFLKPGGTLFITLPNFKSVNGWVQRKFDRENYDKHNISSMDLELLKQSCKALGLKHVEAYYHGKFSVWLENKAEQTTIARLLMKAIWFTGKAATKMVPVESKLLSPYIVLKASL